MSSMFAYSQYQQNAVVITAIYIIVYVIYAVSSVIYGLLITKTFPSISHWVTNIYVFTIIVNLFFGLFFCIVFILAVNDIYFLEMTFFIVLTIIHVIFSLVYLLSSTWVHHQVLHIYLPEQLILTENEQGMRVTKHMPMFSERPDGFWYLMSNNFVITFASLSLFVICSQTYISLVTSTFIALPNLLFGLVFRLDYKVTNIIMYEGFVLMTLCLILEAVWSYLYFGSAL